MDRRRNVARAHPVTIKLMLLRDKEIRVDHTVHLTVKDIARDLYSRRIKLRIIGGPHVCIAPNEMLMRRKYRSLVRLSREEARRSVRFLGGSSRRMNNEKCGEP